MEKLGIDAKLLIAQLVNFGLFFFIFHKFIAKPFLNFIRNEQHKEKEKERLLADLENQKEKSTKFEADAREKMNKELKEEVAKARKEAELIKKDLIIQAKKDAAEIIEQAKKSMEEESRQMEGVLKKKAADLSILMLNQGLKTYLSEQAQKEITREILNNIN